MANIIYSLIFLKYIFDTARDQYSLDVSLGDYVASGKSVPTHYHEFRTGSGMRFRAVTVGRKTLAQDFVLVRVYQTFDKDGAIKDYEGSAVAYWYDATSGHVSTEAKADKYQVLDVSSRIDEDLGGGSIEKRVAVTPLTHDISDGVLPRGLKDFLAKAHASNWVDYAIATYFSEEGEERPLTIVAHQGIFPLDMSSFFPEFRNAYVQEFEKQNEDAIRAAANEQFLRRRENGLFTRNIGLVKLPDKRKADFLVEI